MRYRAQIRFIARCKQLAHVHFSPCLTCLITAACHRHDHCVGPLCIFADHAKLPFRWEEGNDCDKVIACAHQTLQYPCECCAHVALNSGARAHRHNGIGVGSPTFADEHIKLDLFAVWIPANIHPKVTFCARRSQRQAGANIRDGEQDLTMRSTTRT